jgi:hypothetical protein
VTLIALMIAGSIILVALLGFVTAMNGAARSTALGHRRTVASHLRTALLERMAVTPRDRIQTMTADAWVVDGCYDTDARLVASNATLDAGFECPEEADYRSWLRIEPGATRMFAVRGYVERTDAPCKPEDRFASATCAAADLLLTD